MIITMLQPLSHHRNCFLPIARAKVEYLVYQLGIQQHAPVASADIGAKVTTYAVYV